MKKLIFSFCLLLLTLYLMAAAPEVSNVIAEQQENSVIIDYHLLHADEKMCQVSVLASADGGLTYDIVPTALSGDVGIIEATQQGADYRIVWDYATDNIASGTNYRIKVIADDEIPAIPSPNVVVLTAVDLPFFVQIDEMGIIMLAGAPPNYYALGTILAMAPSPQIPLGIMRKVVGSFTSGGLVYIETVNAKLEEAFQQVQFSFSEPLPASKLVSAKPLVEGVTFLPPAKDFTLPTIALDVTIPLDDGVEITVSGEVEITLGYDFSVSCNLLQGLYKLKAGGHGDVATTVEVGINGGFSIDKDIEIAEYTFAMISFMAGPVPVWMTPSIAVVLQLEAGGGASITTSVTATATFGAGVKYDKYSSPRWSTYSDFDLDFGYDPPSLSVGLHASAAVGPQLELNLYSVAGPYVFAGGYLDLAADFLDDPWWTLKGGFKVDAGVEFEVLSFELSWGTTVFDYSEVLAQATTPPPQEVAQPTFSPGAGSYEGTQNVSISCTTSGASIYYTLDGTTPTESSNLYSAAVPITATATLKARAFNSGYNPSPVASADYTITAAWVENPTFSPAAGSYLGSLNVTISCATDGASIYYTTDGSAPTESSLTYNNPFTLTSSTTVRAKAYKDGYTASYIASIHYVLLTQQSFVATADASIHFSIPNTNDGTAERLTVRNAVGHPQYPPPPASWNIDTLLMFDLSSIASDADIASATLKLYYYDYKDNDPAGRTLSVFSATEPWNEGNVTWNNQPAWSAVASATANVPATTYNWMEWDVTSDVQAFVSGARTNYGWKVTDLLPWNNYNIPIIYFMSREYSSTTVRPRLEVQLSAKAASLSN